MALIDQQEAAKQIRGNKEYVSDCQWLKGYNKACEDNAQIVEQMKGQEIIHCKNCKQFRKPSAIVEADWGWCSGWHMPPAETFVKADGFCHRAEKKGQTE